MRNVRRAGFYTSALFACMASGLTAQAQASLPKASQPDIVVFVRPGCPHCADAERYLEALRRKRQPQPVVVLRDVVADTAARSELRRLSELHGVRAPGVPTFLIRGKILVGFDDAETTGRTIEAMLDRGSVAPQAAGRAPTVGSTCAPDSSGAVRPCAAPAPAADGSSAGAAVRLPLLGSVSVQRVGLPLFTLAIGLLDGFNPCAMWVLLFLLSVLVGMRSRGRMLLIGGVFLLTSGAVYFAFMAAWLNVFLLLGFSRWIQLILGGVALLIGLLNLKDFFAFGRGPSIGIPEKAKPTIYKGVRRVLTARSTLPSLAAVIALAALVNTVELLCTAGLPALYTQVLAMRGLNTWEYYAYLALYNVFYMLDDMIVLSIAVVTLSNRRLQQDDARWLKLVAGTLMFALGAVLVLRPEWLAR